MRSRMHKYKLDYAKKCGTAWKRKDCVKVRKDDVGRRGLFIIYRK